MIPHEPKGSFSEDEATRRRDEVIRHMANTPPKPHETPRQKPKKAKSSGAAQSSRKPRVTHAKP